ncbi:MAG: hypothetical protein M0Z95_18215 [Actinomycetota bacterium]|nr:hypothetical protein [Actinomycetota bacterium]
MAAGRLDRITTASHRLRSGREAVLTAPHQGQPSGHERRPRGTQGHPATPVGTDDGPPACRRPRPPQAPEPGQLAGLARALVALAEETRGDRLAVLALSRSDRPTPGHIATGKKKGGRSCAA